MAGQVIWAENVINIDSPSNAVTQMKKTNTRYVISCMIDLKSKRLTGILSPHVRLTPPDTGVYTLDGRLIQHPTTAATSRLPRGIYIINHRKVAVK